MRFSNSFCFWILFIFLGNTYTFAQGDRCSNIQPFCAGTTQYIFSNSNSENSTESTSEPGPYYGCLDSRPYPAWFFLKIEKSGKLVFEISQNVKPDGSGLSLDVDFIAWGPFSEGSDFCSSSSLSAANVVDCSYEPATTENFTIPNAVQGEIYVVLITNYSESPGYISLSQTNLSDPNAGSTDCSIVNILGDDQTICGKESTQLKAMNVNADSFKWYKFDTSTNQFVQLPGESGSTLTVTESGRYKIAAINSVTATETNDEIKITFADKPLAGQPSDLVVCNENPDKAIFDLTRADSELLQNYSSPEDFSTNFYANSDTEEPIENPEHYEGSSNQQIFATISQYGSGCVSDPVSFHLKIDPPLDISLPDTTFLCVDADNVLTQVISLGKDLGSGYTYTWNPPNDPDADGIQNPIFYLDEVPPFQDISLTVTDKNSGCTVFLTTQLKTVKPPGDFTIDITGSDFNGGYTATVVLQNGEETGEYEFQLDAGAVQSSPVFTHVSAGDHSISVKQINGCGQMSKSFQLVGYPRFFTPNSDGYNDRWNILSREGKLRIFKILIFNRYGKLLKELDPNGNGWDGTLNGNPLPADDYWFYLEYSEDDSSEIKHFKGHFTLKR